MTRPGVWVLEESGASRTLGTFVAVASSREQGELLADSRALSHLIVEPAGEWRWWGTNIADGPNDFERKLADGSYQRLHFAPLDQLF